MYSVLKIGHWADESQGKQFDVGKRMTSPMNDDEEARSSSPPTDGQMALPFGLVPPDNEEAG